MNKWECNAPGCTITASGSGGAIGLRAIGWYFERGPRLFCPFHFPDAELYHSARFADDEQIGKRCAPCTAEAHARHWQTLMRQLGSPEIGW